MLDRKEFINKLCDEIHFSKIKNAVADEILGHIEDQKEKYIKYGLSDEEAELKAVASMGDPIETGKRLNKVYYPHVEWPILIGVFGLIAFGGAISFFLFPENSSLTYFGIYLLVGTVILFLTMSMDYTLLSKHPVALFFGLYFLLFLMTNFAVHKNGVKVSVCDPVLLLMPALSGVFYGMRGRGIIGIFVCSLLYLLSAILICQIPRFSILMVVTLCFCILIAASVWRDYFGIGRKKGFILLASLFCGMLLLFIIFGFILNPNGASYLAHRLSIMLHPEADPMGYGYQGLLIKNILAGARLLGEGTIPEFYGLSIDEYLGTSMSSGLLLTFVIGKWGFIAGAALISIFCFVIIRMAMMSFRQKSSFAFLLSLSCTMAFASQGAIFILTNLGIGFMGSNGFPFVSYGARGLIVNMILLGLMLSALRIGWLEKKLSVSSYKKYVEIEDGKIIIYYK